MGRKKLIIGCVLALFISWAAECQTLSLKYSTLEPSTIRDRLSLYKGDDAERRSTLTRLFEEAGCKDDFLRIQPVKDADAPNVICTLPGETESVIIVGAHFDRVNVGDGVVDNWSGASLLPSLYQSLSSTERHHTFVFIGFTDEEEGFIGSRFYVDSINRDEKESIQAMVDMDTLGLGPTEVWANNSDETLLDWLFRVASETHLPLSVMNVDAYGNSDGSSFKQRGIPIITVHTVTQNNIRILHSKDDRFSAIRMKDYYDSYKLVTSYLAALDQLLDRGQTTGSGTDHGK